jgi:hypothetical protein
MEEIIRKHGQSEDVAEEDIAEAVKLATKLGKIVDRFGIYHFFLVLDALGLFPSRDSRMETVYEMAHAAHRAQTREGDLRRPSFE